uniref:Uncharacterized protein n=1 Tax=Macrostomum lignano TaxID=282301 RepID=A0A1I8FDQ0_9PLAT
MLVGFGGAGQDQSSCAGAEMKLNSPREQSPPTRGHRPSSVTPW